MNRLRPLLLLAFCSFLFACQPNNENQPFVLTLAHMNDTHSQFDPVNAELKGPLFGKQGETDTLYTRFGGYPRLLTMAKSFQPTRWPRTSRSCCCTAAMPGRAAATSSSTRGWPTPSC